MRASPLLCVLLASLVLSCSHGIRGATPESLKSAAEELHQRMRWKDWRGMVDLLVPDRRKAFIMALKKNHDDRDLSVSDYELLDAKLQPERGKGVVISRVSWVRLPSMTEESDELVSRFEFLNGGWLLDSQEGALFGKDLAP